MRRTTFVPFPTAPAVTLWGTALLLLFSVSTASAQEVRRAFDPDGRIETIDSRLAEKLGLFSEYEGFQEARLYQQADSAFVLEIVYRPGPETLRDRRSLSASEVERLRARVEKRLRSSGSSSSLDQEGRTELLVNSTLLSLGFYGYALPVSLGIEDGTGVAALYMLTSGAGFFAPYALTRDRPVTEGQTKLFQYGGTRGIAHGALIGLLAAGDELSVRGFMGSALATSVGEALAGFGLAGTRRIDQGTAETIGAGGDFGLGLGLGVGFLIDPDDPEPRTVAGPALAGSLAGLLTGRYLSRRTTYTPGDARVLRVLGSLGALSGLAAADLAGIRNTRALLGSTMATSVVGFGLAHRLLRSRDVPTNSGTFTALGTTGGGLTGLGIAYLLTGEEFEDADATPFLTLGTLGAAAGFGLMYRTFAEDAPTNTTGWRLQLRPVGLTMHTPLRHPSPSRASPTSFLRPPLLTVTRSF